MGQKGSKDERIQKDTAIVERHENDFTNDISLARFLKDKYPSRSERGWASFINRIRKKNKSPDTYDAKTDIYYTYLSSADKLVALPGNTHRGMMTDYSETIGSPLSSAEVCNKWEFPSNWFDEYRRKHNWTHSMVPLTNEQIRETDEEGLVEQLLHMKRSNINQMFEKKEIQNTKKKAAKWDNLFENLMAHINSLPKIPTVPIRPMVHKENARPYALVVSPTDFHYGKYGWTDEVGETYDLNEAEVRLMERTERLMSMLPHTPDRVIVTVGSDWFHVDNDLGATTKGTGQDMAGTPAEILMGGFDLARRHIELLRQIGPIELICMPGNHDKHTTLALMMYLQASFSHCGDVSVNLSPALRQYTQYGNTLIGFTHGDGKAINNLPGLMAHEQRIEWGEHPHHIWFHGHLHHRKSEEKNGCMIIQMPSLAGEDRWHSHNGYITSTAGLAAYILDKEEGLISSLFAPVA